MHPFTDDHLEALRADFEVHGGRSLALPLAGAAVWSTVAAAGLLLDARLALYVLVLGTGAVLPLGMMLAPRLGERLLDNPSPLAKLMGMAVLMVNLLWAVHLTVFVDAPEYVPLTLGVGLGLHWIVFSWVIGHPVGVVHALLRTVLVTGSWWALPDQRIGAVAGAVVVAYLVAILQLRSRTTRRARPRAPAVR